HVIVSSKLFQIFITAYTYDIMTPKSWILDLIAKWTSFDLGVVSPSESIKDRLDPDDEDVDEAR
ncbi:hypothetical protein ACJX0J_040251, partial [Zea mays]